MELIATLVIVVALLFWGVAIYNKLVTLKNRFKNAFAQIEVKRKVNQNIKIKLPRQ